MKTIDIKKSHVKTYKNLTWNLPGLAPRGHGFSSDVWWHGTLLLDWWRCACRIARFPLDSFLVCSKDANAWWDDKNVCFMQPMEVCHLRFPFQKVENADVSKDTRSLRCRVSPWIDYELAWWILGSWSGWFKNGGLGHTVHRIQPGFL